MKNPSIFPKTIPDWQTERAAKLQRACLSVQGAVGRGEKISRAIRRVSRRYHRRNYKRDRSRRLALAPGTLRRLWDKWKIGGEVPAAFKLHYYSRPPFIPRPLLIRFCEFCATRRLPWSRKRGKSFRESGATSPRSAFLRAGLLQLQGRRVLPDAIRTEGH